MEESANMENTSKQKLNQLQSQIQDAQLNAVARLSSKNNNGQPMTISLTKSRKNMQNIYDDQQIQTHPRRLSIKVRYPSNSMQKSTYDAPKVQGQDYKNSNERIQAQNRIKYQNKQTTFQRSDFKSRNAVEQKIQTTENLPRQKKNVSTQQQKVNSNKAKKSRKNKQQVSFQDEQKKNSMQQNIKIHYQKSLLQKQPVLDDQSNKVSGPSSPLIKSVKSVKSLTQHDYSPCNEEFDRLSRKTRQTFRSTRSSCEDYLGHVFDYYCKLSYAIGKDPTFDQIQQKIRMMTITNFMLFCRDFNIREHVQRDKLVYIFKKNSSYQKYLTPYQFHVVVEQVSDLMFKEFSQDRRFGRILVFLEIHNSFSFVKKMNRLGVIFRLKNKRGIDVNLSPKYIFKLTTNNGKSQQQIALQVKERNKLRKILKQQKIEWHRKNKTNKIDQLYKNGVKCKNQNQILDKKTGNMNKIIGTQIKFIQQDRNPLFSNSGKITRKEKELAQDRSMENKSYYNPCEILTQRTENTYQSIHNLKKKINPNSTNSNNVKPIDAKGKGKLQKQESERYPRQTQSSFMSINRLSQSNLQYKQFRINKIISQAKNAILEQELQNNEIKGSICNSRIIEDKQNKSKAQGGVGYIRRQNNLKTLTSNLHKQMGHGYHMIGSIMKNSNNIAQVFEKGKIQGRKSKQIRQAQILIQQQIKMIPQTITQAIVKPKHFIRSIETVEKQNTRQISELEEMIGIKDQNGDQLLQKHLLMEKKYQLELYRVQRIGP